MLNKWRKSIKCGEELGGRTIFFRTVFAQLVLSSLITLKHFPGTARFAFGHGWLKLYLRSLIFARKLLIGLKT